MGGFLLERLAWLAQPPAAARLLDFGTEMNRYGLTFTIAEPLRSSRVTAGLLLEIWKRFEARGILTAPSGVDSPGTEDAPRSQANPA
jgi:hypothetical protein